jgi:hypothetical protein
MKIVCSVVILFISGVANAQVKAPFGTNDYIRALKQATDIMVNDVTSPVAASRYYAYITLAANETASQFSQEKHELGNKLNEFKPIKVSRELVEKSNPQLAVILALYESSSRFLPSGRSLLKNIDSLKSIAQNRKIPAEKVTATAGLVSEVVKEIMQYANSDGFSKLSGMKRFTPKSGDEYWQPTAPGFMSALEPNWNTLRPFLLDSAAQYSVDSPNMYNTDSTSLFFKQLKEVYTIVNNLSKDQAEMAMFWDCNPYALQQMGHLEFGLKKISPGGHWIGITGIACKKNKVDLFRAAYVHTIVSIGLADAFIACWYNKYQSNRVRPETAIRKLIDRNWRPLLQTPPFPEYTSGHSVVSTVSATILSSLFGNHFAYVDDTEQEFGIAPRRFNSFNDAAKEAAISRLYGGIHFRDAVVNGEKEGVMIGQHVVSRIRS